MKWNHLTSSGQSGEFETRSSSSEVDQQVTNIALAHEVRNPLTNINLAVGMLRSEPHIANQELFLDIIHRASFRIEGIIRGFLAQSKEKIIHSGKHSIHQLLDEVVASAADRIGLKHITVKKKYALQDCSMTFNEPDMRLAIMNIVVNAIEAINKDDGVLKILTKSEHDKFVVQIEDNGCGISKSDLKNIFKPYFTSKQDGIGLGLATTINILRNNHTSIDVSSALNKGTRFKLVLDKNFEEVAEFGVDE